MGVYAIKPKFQQLLKPIADGLVSAKVHPNLINVAGLVIALLMGAAFFFTEHVPALYWILPAGAFLRTACNALDGMVARGLGVSSAIGEVANEVLDRLSDAAIFLSIGFSGHADLGLAGVATAAILINSYVGIVGKSAGGNRVYVGIMGKADRMIIVGVLGIVTFFYQHELVWPIAVMVVIAGTLVSTFQRLRAIKADLK
jgi:CDP-diacylglycerol--glycerol-3-phosphate 3-phosphatidyltransferase